VVEANVLRMFVRGFVEFLILWITSQGPMHGYLIMKKLEEYTSVSYGPGTVYPILYKLESMNLLKGEWRSTGERKVKVYTITDEGIKVLKRLRSILIPLVPEAEVCESGVVIPR